MREGDPLSYQLRSLLDEARSTVEDVSIAAGLGKDTVGRWIRGTTTPSRRTLGAVERQFASLLGRTIDLSHERQLRLAARNKLSEATSANESNPLDHDHDAGLEDATRRALLQYVSHLERELDRDPWTHAAGAESATLSSIQRSLSILTSPDVGYVEPDSGNQRTVDADELADSTTRLVILGGPGEGKTWLARRIAIRTAATARASLLAGTPLTAIELPLYARASVALERTDAFRKRLVVDRSIEASGVPAKEISRLAAALESHPRLLLILDGLDEARVEPNAIAELARDLDDFRIVLTSRPSAWKRQLELDANNPRHRIGHLRPLSLVDIHNTVDSWLADRPELARQLRVRLQPGSELAEQAANPLLCAMYCLAARDGRFPETKRELLVQVIRRLLAGTWRGDDAEHETIVAAEQYLTDLAWQGAENDPISHLGAWPDEIEPSHSASAPVLEMVNHVAGQARITAPHEFAGRRFIHRSLREHLVAQHISGLSAKDGSEVILPHLWFDQDWEETLPLAVAAHPEGSQVLRYLLEAIGIDSASDPFLALDILLARVAGEAAPSFFDDDIAQRINIARIEVAARQPPGWRPIIASGRRWETSNRHIISTLAEELKQGHPHLAWPAASLIADLNPTAAERADVRHHLASFSNVEWADSLRIAASLARLADSPAERDKVRANLLSQLVVTASEKILDICEVAGQLEPTADERTVMCSYLLEELPRTARAPANRVIDLIVGLTDSPELREEATSGVLNILEWAEPFTALVICRRIAELTKSRIERTLVRQRLLGYLPHCDATLAWEVVLTILRLEPTSDERKQARIDFFRHLPEASAWMRYMTDDVVLQLARTADERADARRQVLDELPTAGVESVAYLAEVVLVLGPSSDERKEIRDHLLQRVPSSDIFTGSSISEIVARLDPGPDQSAEARRELTQGLADASPIDAWFAAGAIQSLDPTPNDRATVRSILLSQLMAADEDLAGDIARLASEFVSSPQEAVEVRRGLVKYLQESGSDVAYEVADVLIELEPTVEERKEASGLLVGQLYLVANLEGLAPTDEERASLRQALLDLLPRCDSELISHYAILVQSLDPNGDEFERLRQTLVKHMERVDPWTAAEMAAIVLRTGPTEDEFEETLHWLLAYLPKGGPELAHSIGRLVADFHPDTATLLRLFAVSHRAESRRQLGLAIRPRLRPTSWLSLIRALDARSGSHEPSHGDQALAILASHARLFLPRQH